MTPARARKRFEALAARSGPDPVLSLDSLLGAAASAYGGVLALRAALYRRGVLPSRRLSCPVVSVGNLTVGGTGKTPMVVYLARRLQESGLRPAVLSRGYRGSAEGAGGVVSDGGGLLLSAAEAGDEPWMIAGLLPGVPVAVGKDRFRAGRELQRRFCPDVVLLDDGYQHLRLARDLDLLLLDAQAPLGNGRIFPRGALREPASAAARADAVILTRVSGPHDSLPAELANRRSFRAKPLLRAVHLPRLRKILGPAGAPAAADRLAADLGGARVFAFSGIAANEAFQRSIEDLGGRTASARGFADHHRYRPRERAELEKAAVRAGADLIATTEKDLARLEGQNPFSLPLAVVGVEMSLASGQEVLDRLLARKVLRRGGD